MCLWGEIIAEIWATTSNAPISQAAILQGRWTRKVGELYNGNSEQQVDTLHGKTNLD